MHNEDEMKKRGDEPVTKRDLWAHEAATKKDLQTHAEATKKDLQTHAETTKKDLQTHAETTKEDMRALESAMKKDLQTHAEATKRGFQAASERMDRFEKVVKNLAVEVTGVKKELTHVREDFSAALKRTESRLIGHIDGFMAKTVKVERDQSILIHRMDRIEDRVSRIENRPS